METGRSQEVLGKLQKVNKSSVLGPHGVTRDDLLMWDMKGGKLADLLNCL